MGENNLEDEVQTTKIDLLGMALKWTYKAFVNFGTGATMGYMAAKDMVDTSTALQFMAVPPSISLMVELYGQDILRKANEAYPDDPQKYFARYAIPGKKVDKDLAKAKTENLKRMYNKPLSQKALDLCRNVGITSFETGLGYLVGHAVGSL